jgi:hypothetical protein
MSRRYSVLRPKLSVLRTLSSVGVIPRSLAAVADVSEEPTASIMKEGKQAKEANRQRQTSINCYKTTLRRIPEDIQYRGKFKSQISGFLSLA